MKFTLTLLTSLVASTVSAIAVPRPLPEPRAGIASSATDASIIKSTWASWYADVAVVSNFLDNVANKKYKSQTAYLAAAHLALAAQEAQTGFQEILNAELSEYEGFAASNSTLADGTWDNVQTYLQLLTTLNFQKDCEQIQQIVNWINFGDAEFGGLCSVILPAIDTYFSLAYEALLDPSIPGYNPKDASLSNWQTAIRPQACATSKRERDVFDVDVEAVEDMIKE